MIKGFRDFVLRGNVVDLAIAVVIGAAFSSLVSSLVKSLITPLVNAVGTPRAQGQGFSLRHGSPAVSTATFVNVSAVVQAAVTFLVTAAILYFVVVVPMGRLLALRKHGQVPEVESTPEDIALLQEIRDLLAARGGAT